MLRNNQAILNLAKQLQANNLMLATAESCTGGLLAAQLTDLAGASRWFEQGLVTYSNQAKKDLLQVTTELLETYGAVSKECALAMATGLMKNTKASIGIAITGIAGPTGGSVEKPVGTVYFSLASQIKPAVSYHKIFSGNREQIRLQACEFAITTLNHFISEKL